MKKQITVAIFEDDIADQFIYRKILDLQRLDLNVHFIDSYEEGLALARQKTFDYVVIDLHFKGIAFSGIHLLEKLRAASGEQVIAIAMTPLIQEGDLERTQSAGFQAFLEKPFSFEHVAKIKEICSN